MSDSARWAHRLTLLLLFVSGVALRLENLARKPFWSDECFSVEIAWLNWRNLLHLLWWREGNMSLYYVLLKAWLHFGQSALFIRSLSVLIAAATLPAVYWLACLLYDRRVGLTATALFAFNAYNVRYAQEARSYSLFVLLATMSSALLIVGLREPSRRSRVRYIVVSILAVYAHFYALLLLATHWLALRWVGQPEPSEARTSAASSESSFFGSMRSTWGTIGIGVLPLLIFVAKTGTGPIKWIQRPGLHDLFEFFEHLCGGSSWPLAVIYAVTIVAALLPVGGTLLKKNQDWETWRCQFLLLWLLFPIALTVVLSFARPLFLARYMIFCLPALVILAAAGIARLNRSWLLAAALTGVLLLSLQGIFFVYDHDFDNERDASGEATNFVLDHTQPDDAVLFYIPATRIPYEFFRSQRAEENTASSTFASPLGPEILFPRHGAGLDYRDFTGKPTAEFVRAMAPSHPRMWVMLMNNGPAGNPDPTTVMLTQILAEQFPQMSCWQFNKVEVRLYSEK
jgi:mannosyltransferase